MKGENRCGGVAGRAGDKASLEHVAGQRLMLGQRMSWETDAGNGSRVELPEGKGRFFLLVFYAESCMDLLIFHQTQQGRKGNETDGGAKQRELFCQAVKYRGQQFLLQMVMTADLEGNEMFMAPQTFPGRVGGPQDQFRIGQKLNAF